ncbi:putative phosphatidylinositol 3-related kinase [Leptomonas pyrrhocoris]|uniref:Serine/threonine-protein kinase ATR n=1 Tax=Leptomonas pyrrhocoris TaxID=157538 RepID=A0A0N0DYY1_LEPPY|nr:putative phosphatidylinositol 3-related kinase [Leptomonas pyrrhocoris]KPA84688.1 putative phosphatidylinositol 3-related kinase [Leptomonas pyrrhocoris]|eukprot:XP_015663127.1 putative phosphatidylinositol 3-related kinase [Leptomonas pyrrhocoris]
MNLAQCDERAVVRQRTESNNNNSGSASTSGRNEGSGLRDELAEIGESIKALQAQLSGLTSGAPPHQNVVQKLWSLLWQLRPFLFLASPATVRQWRSGSEVFQLHHRRHYAKDAAHVAIALRLYVVLLRFTVICPSAMLHGCLTLLSVFSVLNDPRLRSWKDSSERLQEVFLFVLRASHASDALVLRQVTQIMDQLLSEVTEHFDEVAPDVVGQQQTTLYLDLSMQPLSASLIESDPIPIHLFGVSPSDDLEGKTHVLHELFSTHVCVETQYEARCIQTGLLQLLVRLVEQSVVVYVPRERVILLCDTACHLVSGAVPGEEGGVVNRVQHDAAWHAIQFLIDSHFLLPHVHGPLLLSVLTAQWQSPSCTSIFDITVAEKSIFTWLMCWNEAELLAVVKAMERKDRSSSGSSTADATTPVTACLAQMWEIAVRWCVELFSAPSHESTTASTQRICTAMRTLGDWVTLCEQLFRCTVHLSSVSACNSERRVSVAVQSDEYLHRLQLLANELPLPSLTAALLCTQVPPLLADLPDAVVFLPHRILSFFALPTMSTYVTTVVERSKNCVDASAHRLLDANARSVLCTLPTSSVGYQRCDADAFRMSFEETMQVVQHHESPSYALLVQAFIVLLHFFPPDGAPAASSRADVLPRLVQEMEVALAARLSNKTVLPGVHAALWKVLCQKAAVALFSLGSGLSWSRKALSPPELCVLQPRAMSINSSGMEAFLSRVAGVTEGLRGAFARGLADTAEVSAGSGDVTFLPSTLSVFENKNVKLARLRCAYDGLTNLLAVAVQLFSVLENILRSFERCCIQWRAETAANGRNKQVAVSSGTLVPATSLFTAAAGLQLLLLEAKYTFACIAGPSGEGATSPMKDTRTPKSRSKSNGKRRSPRKRGSAAPAVVIVVDVDDDDDNDADEEGNQRDEETAVKANTARGGAAMGSKEGPEEETHAPHVASKTHLLERLIEVHRLHLLQASVSALQAVSLADKDGRASSLGEAADGSTDFDDASPTWAAKAEAVRFRAALLRFTFTTVAFAPPARVEEDVRACFALHTIVPGGDRELSSAHALAPLAAREVMMWSTHIKGASVVQSNTGRRSALFLQWLCATDKFVSLCNANAHGLSAAAVADATQDTISLLWLARRCFQDRRAASAVLSREESIWMLSRDSLKKQETCFVACDFVVQEARGWLALCFDLYSLYNGVRSEASDAALSVMGLCIETARDVMTLFAWSATDLLRFRERPFVFSSFLKAIVDKEDRDMTVVLTASLDVLGRYLISSDNVTSNDDSSGALASRPNTAFIPGSESTRARLKRVLERERITDWSSVAGALAYVLYECSGKPLARQMQYLEEIMSCLGKSVADVPAMVRSSKHVIAFHLVSLEADAQLLARDQRRRSGRERRSPAAAPEVLSLAGHLGNDAHRLFQIGDSGTDDNARCEDRVNTAQRSGEGLWVLPDDAHTQSYRDNIAFSVFERAVEQMVTLCESTDTVTGVESALRKPVGRAVAAEELWKSMFAVLDSIYKAIRIEPTARYNDGGSVEEDSEAVPGSLRTRRRWLLGLASFIRFMGPQTTPIALMLPTLLERCSRLPGLVPFVCVVWKELACACTEEYLAESAPSIALSLVSLERYAAPQAESRLLLASALQHLYKRTESAGFWDSYKVVLGSSSTLVDLLLKSRKLDEESRTSAAKGKNENDVHRESHLLSGFVEVMRSGSLQSTTVFVRALYEYLSKADTAERLQLSRAASLIPEVVQTLLRCSEADSESAVYAMRCISIIGAVTPPASVAAVRSNDTAPPGAANDVAEANRSSQSLPASPSAFGMWCSTAGTGGPSSYLDAETVLNWRKFCFTLLRDYFPRVFASTADPVLHNCIAFAVQELIRASTTQERLQNRGVKLRSEDVVHVDELERYLWWARLMPHVKQLLGGFTTTRYSLTVNWQTRLRAPEYTPNLSYRRWLFNVFNHLVASCEGWFAEMVQPLRNVAKRNSSLILYLLPYLVVHLLESGKVEDEQYLEGEMKTVLEAIVGGPSRSALSLRSQSLYEAHPDTMPLHEPREHAHTILDILEDVEQLRWSMLRNRGRIPCVFDQQEQAESACIQLSERYAVFLRRIPWTLRCRAALKIGSYVRALRSVEGQRRIPDLSTVTQTVPLQRIFAALGDRESSRAIHRASPGLSLEDTAFSYENNGDWLAAMRSSELVLQHHPTSGQHQLTALHCMNELGELYMTSRYAASLLASPLCGTLLATQPVYGGPAGLRGSTTFSQLDAGVDGAAQMDAAELRGHVLAYANEAAWRLGQWDSLLPDELTASNLLRSGASVSLAMAAAQLQRELTGRCALPRARAVTDVERLKIVPMVRTPRQEDVATHDYTFTLLLHALGDVDAVSDLLCTSISVLDEDGDGKGPHSNRGPCGAGGRSTPSRISAALLPSAVKEEIISLLSLRESYVEDTISAREPLLSLHRMVYRELGAPQKVAETWLKQSELLRNAGLGEAALTAARQAAYECPEHIVHTNYYTLVAHLLHDTQSATPAMEFARECVADPRIPAATRAQVQMLLTNWLVETGSERPERVFAEYDKARELDRRSELVHYHMAVFYDHLHTLAMNASESAAAQLTTNSSTAAAVSGGAGAGVGPATASAGTTASASAAALYSAVLMQQKETVESIRKYAVHAIAHFGEALLRGTEKASVSLPRLLTLWLDTAAFLGTLMSTTAGKLDGSAASLLEEMNTKVRTFILSTVGATIPPGVVMMALPQLLSRLAHRVPSVRTVLTDVLVHLLNCFPQQCLWLVLPMALSKEGPKEIVETQLIRPFADNPRNERVLRYAKIICDTLLTICNCSASLFPKERGLTLLSPVQKINPMLPDASFILPVLSTLTPNITADEPGGVFPTSPCFHHFEDRVLVMRSLQKPKRIWVATNEGREMSFLCKAKDEPRKDIRMMEVATLMNSFFLSDPEAKRKRFSLRRYSVTALSDDCAVIEWMKDTTTLAKVAMECYSLDRSGVHISSVKKWLALVDEKKLSKMDLFTKYILPEAPAVMHQWLDRTFASNQSWYEARNLFTQSTALWSIAGHIVGLGDRHAENLMIDMERGELMHVDFACMFDKGEKLEVPEQVRFRLTQNLTDVMGVLGAYGPFQAACEVALRCEMKNKSAVMSIVETLLHEPLVEWRRQSSRSNSFDGPKQLMERVARRLDGFLDLYSVPPQRDTLSLNVESQVAKLIHHSSDLNNLSQMYIWWMAWI